jgi:4-hydroxy-tetrahydrodipicolinate synthase
VLYNVPGRTAREIEVETVIRLAAHPNVLAVKEATGNVDRASRLVSSCALDILSGDDSLTLPMMAVGAKGVISVASNVAPAEVAAMTGAALRGDWAAARGLHRRLFPLFSDLFIDTNPIPVKAALAMRGEIEEVYRLPLCAMSEGKKEKLRETLAALGLLAA